MQNTALAGIALEKNGLACFQRDNRPTQAGFGKEDRR
jgi:hypothetical protein